MIIAKLDGRLGNQMFVYAMAYALAREHKEPLAIYKFEYDTIRREKEYGLDQMKLEPFKRYIGIPVSLYVHTLKEILCCVFRIDPPKRELFSPTLDIIEETGKEVSLDKNKKKHLVRGFWQSPIYFDKYRADIIGQMIPNFQLSKEGRCLCAELQKQKFAVSIHIRRGDYVGIGWCIDLEFYGKAMKYIKSNQSDCKFYVFSDDIEWVKENLLTEGYNVFFVERDYPVKPFEDIWLMSKCRGNIIANSSFSWWGAYLNQNVNKVVVAPKEIRNTISDISDDWIIM